MCAGLIPCIHLPFPQLQSCYGNTKGSTGFYHLMPLCKQVDSLGLLTSRIMSWFALNTLANWLKAFPCFQSSFPSPQGGCNDTGGRFRLAHCFLLPEHTASLFDDPQRILSLCHLIL